MHGKWRKKCTENGETLIDLSEENDLVIGETLFQHKTIHKLTWTSPNGRTKSEFDHVIINRKWRRTLQDVRVMQSADVGSDHNLVMA
jgi:endonuclease/exonuclease/phosphatase family metal-dependent hydrolase